MTSWKRFTRRDCPVCYGARRDCRQNLSNNLIHCRHAEANPSDYVYRGQDSLGFGLWAYKPDADKWNEEKRLEWQERVRARKEADKAKHRQSLSDKERNQEVKGVFNQLYLSESDRDLLKSRKYLPEEFILNCVSVKRWQPLREAVNPALPGISPNGRQLNNPIDGILIPIINHAGQWVGMRLYNPKADENGVGKYTYLSSKGRGITPHNQTGEHYLAVHIPDKPAPVIGFCEGLEFKPAIAAERLGIPIIGASGGNFASSPETLWGTIAAIEARLGKCEYVLFPDGGSRVNKNVRGQYEKLHGLIQLHLIADWGQWDEKSGGDIDEIDDLSAITFTAPEKFFGEVDEGIDLEPDSKAYREHLWWEREEKAAAEAHEEYREEQRRANHDQKVINAQRKLNNFTYPVDLLLNTKYLPDLVALTKQEVIPEKGILNLKSHKGGGKSTQLKHLIAYYKAKGKNIVSIVPRIALGRAQAVDWDIEYIDDARADLIGAEIYRRNCQTLGCCWDSLGKTYERDWSDTVLIIDESEQGLSHLVTSSTLKDRRSFVLRTFQEKIVECLSDGGLVILSDADLTDISVDYIKALAPQNTPIFSIVNEYKPEPLEIEFYTGKRDFVIDQLSEKVEEGLKAIVATDSQREAEALERVLANKYPEKKIVRIDGKTCAQEWGKEFVENINESISEYKPDVLIYTSSMGTGVSITVSHFDVCFGFFFGVLEPSQCRQMLWRERNPIPRIIWCEDYGIPSGCPSPLPETIKKTIYKYNNDALKICDLLEMKEELDDDQVLLKLSDFYRDMADEKGQWNNPHLNLYANFKARHNYGISDLALILRQQLIEEGHNLTDYFDDEATNLGHSVKETKEELKVEESIAIAGADDIDLEVAKHLRSKPNKSEEEQHQVTKAFLKHELPGVELTPNFVHKAIVNDYRCWLNRVKLFWYCQNPEKTKFIDKGYLKSKIVNLRGVTLLSDFRTLSPKVKLIHDLGLFALIDLNDPEREYSGKDEEVIKFKERAYFLRYKIYQSFGLTVTLKTDPIKLIEKLLERLGLDLESTGQRRVGEERIRYYRLDPDKLLDPDRLQVLAALDRKYSEVPTGVGIGVSQDSPKVLYIGESCDRGKSPNIALSTSIEVLGDYAGDVGEIGGDDLENLSIDRYTGELYILLQSEEQGFGRYVNLDRDKEVRRSEVNLIPFKEFSSYSEKTQGRIIEEESTVGDYCVEFKGERSFIPRDLWHLYHRQQAG